MHHNYWACALEPGGSQLLKPKHSRNHAPKQEKPLQLEAYAPQLDSSPCSPWPEKSLCSNKDPVQPILKWINHFFKEVMYMEESFTFNKTKKKKKRSTGSSWKPVCFLHKFGLYLLSNDWQLQSFRLGRGAIIYKAIVKARWRIEQGDYSNTKGEIRQEWINRERLRRLWIW